MLTAEQREIALMPHILKMERRGINLDGAALKTDSDYYWSKLEELDELIQDKLHCRVDIDSNNALADAIERAGKSKGFGSTPTGKRSTAKESLINAIDDPELLGPLLMRGALATCLRTFIQPWYVQFQEHGRLFLQWNQFRNYTDTGARTGRLSSSPNLQNIPVEWEKLLKQLASINFVLPFPLPSVRKYIVPDPGCIFIGRDYSSQELRLLAHFAQGTLLDILAKDPYADLHKIAAKLANITRTEAKTLAFAILYGAGIGRIAESLAIDVGRAAYIKAAYLTALPEIERFTKETQNAGRQGKFVETIGGRRYYAEPGKVIMGRFRTFEYKLVNYRIQGSAADQTKQAMLDYCENTRTGELVLTVHDQLVAQCPIEDAEREAQLLGAAMNGAFQEILRYRVISDEFRGFNFAEL